MKQVLYDKSGRVRIQDALVPEIGKNEVLVQNSFSVLTAGTEKSMLSLMKKPIWKKIFERPELAKNILNFSKDDDLKGTAGLVKNRVDLWHLLGYSSSGVVIRAGSNVEDLGVGDRVACIGSGFASHSEYVAVPRNLCCKLSKSVHLDDAAFAGIASTALQSIRQLNPQLGENIVVVGLGPVGKITAQMLRANGCNVIGVDIDKESTKKEYIDEGITENSVKSVMKATNGMGADGVIIAATSKHNLVNDAFGMCRNKGRVVLLGFCGMEIDRDKMFEKELEFKISTAFGAGSFDIEYANGRDYPYEYVRWTVQRNMKAVVDLIETKKIDFTELKQYVYGLDEAEKAYKNLYDGSVMTAVFSYKPNDEIKQTIEINKHHKNKKVNIAIVGAGDYVKNTFIPSVKGSKDFSVYAIATKSGHDAKRLAEEMGAKYASTSYMDLLNDKNVDLVIVGGDDENHAEISNAAIKKGKHVFCEKPMAIEEEEFDALVKTIKKSKSAYSCRFTKRYSPSVQKIKGELKENVPLMINYIFNKEHIRKEGLADTQEAENPMALSEVSGIVDLFNYLTGSKPITIEAQKINAAKGQVDDKNNIMALIKYQDGSVCTFSYSCMGSNSVERDRCTLIQDGNVYEMEGFTKVKENARIILKSALDEGYAAEIKELDNFMNGRENSLITSKECINATKTAFDIFNRIKNKK